MIEKLLALANGRPMGCVSWDRKSDRLSFAYDAQWQRDPANFPLSLSMPLASAEHGHRVVETFLWGLLPDNDGVLKRWGERFHVSPRNAFKLLSHVGEECAGAVQFVKPERAEEWLAAASAGRVKWMDEAEIAERMRLLLQDHSASRMSADRGQFSLAGAQPKTAFHYDPRRDRWGVPSGFVPTTHIFKPATGDFDGYAENEHFCLALARALGLPVAASTIRYFGEVPAIVVERYDRLRTGARVQRIHQEDMCQALARMPHQKYQSQGGPSAVEIMALIRQYSGARAEDEGRFLDALIWNWLIAGTDAHAKNYAFLIGARGSVRLAPLYDLSSALPYPRQVYPRHAALAMKVGGKSKLVQIGAREWRKCAVELRLDETAVRDRMRRLAAALPDTAADIQRAMKARGIKHSVLARLVSAMKERAVLGKAMWE